MIYTHCWPILSFQGHSYKDRKAHLLCLHPPKYPRSHAANKPHTLPTTLKMGFERISFDLDKFSPGSLNFSRSPGTGKSGAGWGTQKDAVNNLKAHFQAAVSLELTTIPLYISKIRNFPYLVIVTSHKIIVYYSAIASMSHLLVLSSTVLHSLSPSCNCPTLPITVPLCFMLTTTCPALCHTHYCLPALPHTSYHLPSLDCPWAGPENHGPALKGQGLGQDWLAPAWPSKYSREFINYTPNIYQIQIYLLNYIS